MVDEWSEIEKKIFSPQLVFGKTHGGGEESAGALILARDLRKELTSEQELVYKLVDGTRAVQDIVDRSLLGKFNASEILAYLLEVGLIEIVRVQAPNLAQKVSRVNFREYIPMTSFGGLLILVFLLLVYFTPNFLHYFFDSRIEQLDIEIPTHFAQKTQLDRIKNALEIYFLERGNYPNQLEELVSAQLLRKSDLFYHKGISYQYELRDGRYFLKH
jgi:hypothetical protein